MKYINKNIIPVLTKLVGQLKYFKYYDDIAVYIWSTVHSYIKIFTHYLYE